jgi:hypothetical protein
MSRRMQRLHRFAKLGGTGAMFQQDRRRFLVALGSAAAMLPIGRSASAQAIGRGIVAVPSTDVVNVKDARFGATGDGIADDTAAIQAAIDFAVQNNVYWVYLPVGTYRTSDTLHIGYGLTTRRGPFVSLALVGAGGFGTTGLTKLALTRLDRPGVNIQGIRNGGIANLWIRGPGSFAPPFQRSLAAAATAANYVPAGAKDDPRAPYCAVSIDAYGGAAPENPYPTPNYPAFYGKGVGAYGRATSSAPFVIGCFLDSTLIGIACQTNCDSNGDFLNAESTVFSSLKVSVAWGNVNARSNVLSNTNHWAVHTLFDTVSYGSMINRGNCAGNYENIHANGCYRWFNIDRDYGVSFSVINPYSENTLRIGDIAGNKSAFSIVGGAVETINYRSDGRQIVEEYVEHILTTGLTGTVKIKGTRLSLFRTAASFSGEVQLEEFAGAPPSVNSGTPLGQTANEQTAAWRCFSGLLLAPLFNKGAPARLRNALVVDGSGVAQQPFGEGDSTWISNYYASKFENNGIVPYLISNWDRRGDLGPDFFGPTTTVGRGFTFTTKNRIYQVGDLFAVNSAQRTWYYIERIEPSGADGYTVLVNALVNYAYDGATYRLLDGDRSSGVYYFPCGIFHVPVDPEKAMVTTAGSPIVGVVDRKGRAASRPDSIVVDSKVLWVGINAAPQLQRFLPFEYDTVVQTAGPQSITMTARAQVSGIWAMCPGIARLA